MTPIIEEVQKPCVTHNMTVAVIIGAGLVQKCLPELGMIKRIRTLTDKVGEIGQKAAEGYAAEQQRLKLLHDAEIEQHEGNDYHNQVFPAALGRKEGGKAGLQRKLFKSSYYIHSCPLTR